MKKDVLLKINKDLEINIKGDYVAHNEHSIIQSEEFHIEKIEINRGNLYHYTTYMEKLAYNYKKGKADDIWVQLEELCLENINNNK